MKKYLLGFAIVAAAFVVVANAETITDLFSTGPNYEFRVDKNGGVYCSSVTATGSITGVGVTTFSSSVTVNAGFISTPHYQILPMASSAIVVTAFIEKISTGTAFTCTATPTISTQAYASGTFVILLGSGSAITLQDNDTASNTCLELGNATRVIEAGDMLGLQLVDDTASASGKKWREMFWCKNSNMDLDVGRDLDVDRNAAIAGELAVASTITITFTTANELFVINQSSGISSASGSDAAQVTVYCSTGEVPNAQYLLRLRYFADGDTEGDFLVCEDNNGDDMFKVTDSGDVTATDAITAGGLITASSATIANSGYFQFGAKTVAELKALTPSAVGQVYFMSDSGYTSLVVSTGTGQGAFGHVASTGTNIEAAIP